MAENRQNTDKEVRDQYQGESTNSRLQEAGLKMEEMIKMSAKDDPSSSGLLNLIATPLRMLINLCIIVVKGIWKIPVRYLTLAILVSWWFYLPTVYLFENIFGQNSPILFDPLYIMSLKNLLTIHRATDQWLTLLIIFFATLPIHTGVRFMTFSFMLLIFSALNIVVTIHLLSTGDLSNMFSMGFMEMYKLSQTGNATPLNLLVSISGFASTLTLYFTQPAFLNPFKQHNLNGLGEDEGGVIDTITGNNTLKNPVKWK